MKRLIKTFIITTSLLLLHMGALSSVELYVSTKGSDNNPGTIEAPLASLEGAKHLVRKLLTSGFEENIVVYFSEGLYYLERTVVFTPNDSPTKNKVVYSAIPGERVVFSSGVPLTKWEKVESHEEPEFLSLNATEKLWSTNIPKGLGCIKTLYQGNQKLKRAIGEGFFPTELDPRLNKNKPYKKSSLNVMCFPKGTMRSWTNIEDVEIRIIPRHQFTMNILPLLRVDDQSLTVTTQIDGTYPLIHGRFSDPSQQASVWVENTPEGLNKPGEWIVNTYKRKIYYWPKEQEEPKNIVAPSLKEFIRFEGNEKAKLYTKNIALRGFTFMHGERDTWDEKTKCIQHDYATYDRGDALVRFRFAENCKVEFCEFTNSGGMGVRCDLYAQNIEIENNKFSNLGAGAIMLGGYGPGQIDVNKKNRVINNHIHDIGQEYWQSSAILIYQSGGNLIANNFIHDTPYSGISLVGHRTPEFVQGKNRESAAIRFHETKGINTWPEIIPFLHGSNNIVEYNRLTRIGQKLGDFNGIYISSTGRNNKIQYNYLYDVQYRMSNGAIRSDDQQHDTYINHNVINGCAGRGITMKGRNYCENNFIIDIPDSNDLRNPNEIPVFGYLILRRGPMEGSTIKNNILYHLGTEPHFVFVGLSHNIVTKLSDADTDLNLVYCKGDNFKGDEYLMWARNEQDSEKNSVAADPLFTDINNHDYTFKLESPASLLGIDEIDISKTGLQCIVGPKGIELYNN